MKNRIYLPIIFMLLFLFIVAFSSCGGPHEPPAPAPKNATVDILKIGKADCIIINTGSEIIMIDTGEEENLDSVHAYMQANGYDKIDLLIITHYDKDHIGGAAEIISTYSVNTVFESRFTSSDARYYDYHHALNKNGYSASKLQGDYKFQSADCTIEINVPREKKYANDQDNNSSLVVSLTLGEKKLIFMGDAMEERVEEIIGADYRDYDLIKLPHHGSYLENYEELLEKLKPSYAVSTDSKKNPTDENTLNLLNSLGISTYQTRHGGVHIEISASEIVVTQ